MKLTFWGDISFGLEVTPLVEKHGHSFFFENITSLLSNTDANIVNFDCTITHSTEKNPFRGGSPLKTGPQAAKAMQEAGINVACLANNHIWDYGPKGISDTIAAFEQYNILTAGVGRTLEQAIQPVILSKNGVNCGIISTTNSVGNRAPSDKYVVAPLEIELIRQTIQKYRDQVDCFIIAVHWGREFVNYPFPDQIRAAHQMVDFGAGAVIGHHSHVIGPVEKYHRSVIAYSLGDFIFDQTDHPDLPDRHYGIGLMLEFDGEYPRNYETLPIVIGEDFRPSITSENKREEIMERLNKLSAELKNMDELAKKAYGQASEGLIAHICRSFPGAYRRGGIRSVLRKIRRTRWQHFRLLMEWLRRRIGI